MAEYLQEYRRKEEAKENKTVATEAFDPEQELLSP